ncbi:MAG: response regulator [Tannerella sp.]|jgi:signal transduction histidine kinase/ligand-binding sensor domain-containing protein/CheY-like chemotaxis protein/AraC-like DNA-binding protein|nr:response regulator [Tannerella sp.]
MRRILFVSLLILASLTGLPANGDPAHDNTQYKIRRVSPHGGLGINGQRDVKQDKWGFIWVITVDGLYRFDGYTFKHYTHKLKKPEPLGTWGFERLEIDKNGDIYISSQLGLLRYNPLTDNFDLLLRDNISLVKEDSNGRLWISTPHSIGLFDRNTFKFTPVESGEGPVRNTSAVCAKGNRIYVGASDGNIYRYSEEDGLFRHVFFHPQYNNIVDMIPADSFLYVLTENKGLIVLSAGDYKEIKRYDFFYPSGDTRVSARDLYIDKFRHIWITNQRGIYILNPENGAYTHYYYDKNDPYGLPSSSVWRISEDNQGNLWFGTYSGGICFINLDEQKKLKSFSAMIDDLSYPVVSCFEEDDDYIWIGTEGGGLNRYDKKTNGFACFRHVPGTNSLTYDNIQSLLFTGRNKLWIGTSRGGMDCLDTETLQFTHYTVRNDMLMEDHVARIVAEADSGIWVKYLMNRNWITYLSLKDCKTEHFNFLVPPSGLNGNISDMCRGNGDTLWIASSRQLLIMNVRTKNVSVAGYRHSDIPGFRNINICTILTNNVKNILWMGTNDSGLLMYDISNQSLTCKADLSKYEVHAILSLNEDTMGNLWMGTDNGLFCLDIETDRVHKFNKSDGVQGDTYYPYSTFKSKTGKLYFGGNEGFTVIDSVKNTYNEYKPHVIISDFLLDNFPVISGTKDSPLKTSIFRTKEIVLKHNRNNFSFEFTSSNYLNPDKNRFKYRLKGYDDRWIETDANHRIASYAKVPGGKYTFEIMTANNDGIWGGLSSVPVTIKPAPWFSLWAITGYVLLLFAAVHAIIRHYNYRRKLKIQFYLEEQEKRQKEEAHQEQLKFFTHVSHDFRTPLSLILATVEAVKSGNPVSRYLPVLENNTKRLLALINELMLFRSLQNNKIRLDLRQGDWNGFIIGNISDFHEYALQKGIDFTIELDPDMGGGLYFDVKVMEKIVLNLLNNAFKYTSAGGTVRISTLADISKFKSPYSNSIVVNANENPGVMSGMVIRDSGIGISGESIGLVFERYYRVNESGGVRHLGSGIGLATVKSLIELHKGYIAIYSERDAGTDIVIGFSPDSSIYNKEDFDNGKSNTCLSDTSAFRERAYNEKNIYGTPHEPAIQNKKKILLVEDNDDFRELLAEILNEYYSLKKAANGHEALKILENDHADIIITDIMMPGMNGVELSRTIKGNIETSHIPVVMLTAKTGSENQIESLQSGADAFLEKPVNRQILLLTLSNILTQQMRIREYYSKHYFSNTGNGETHVNKRDADFMKQLADLIEKNLSNTGIDVLYIASSLAVSRRTLYGKVKAMTGQSVVEFVRNYRLRKAVRILSEEDVPVNEVMIRVGFDNASYFSRIFKKEFGKSPSEFLSERYKP